MADRDEIQIWLADFLKQRDPEGRVPAADADLFDGGYLDSLGMILMISAIADRFGITLSPDELSEDSFSTMSAVIELVMKESA